MMKGTAFPKNSYRKPPSFKTWSFSETPTSWSILIWWIFVTKKWTEGWRDETAKRDESKRNSQRLGPLLLLRVPEPSNHCTKHHYHWCDPQSQPMLAAIIVRHHYLTFESSINILTCRRSWRVHQCQQKPTQHPAHGNHSFIDIHFRDLLTFHILPTFPFHNEIKSCL